MNSYEALLNEAYKEGLTVKEKDLIASDGRIKGTRIAIRKNLKTNLQKSCVLAEEMGHHYTSVGNILDMSDTRNRKQERQARLWAYNRLIGLRGIIKAYQSGCQDSHNMADLLGVTEEFLQECIDCYREKYGVCTQLDNYTIFFIPNLAVLEKV
ncbi:ImmA/IrrE family metallo-endopeptidase [Mediterraneibacter sp. NSJ-55]|uniref:ImmA/IrrE family metallo-endopeptidase n=1 Tax=Mediterraneibacter hominis TaxID=2763054 RepID=A0A923LJ66_9FIRM|nr:ImmA/IrrE family metallo-endopeptidase [Mediterraneibacter hominis]MBC5689740.1 ImmA/IrrE family metallo-endopeptidase [Mediterraneibacter hominis]